MCTRELVRIHKFYRTIVRLNTFKHNGQADSRAGDLAALFPASLEEGVEDSRAFLVGYARPGVSKFEDNTLRFAARTNCDQPACGRELDRVR